MKRSSDVILIGEVHRTEGDVHQEAESGLIRHHEPDFVLHEHLGDYDSETGAEDTEIETFARRPGETVDEILDRFDIKDDCSYDLESDDYTDEIEVIEEYSDVSVGELYRHKKDFREWKRYFEAVTGEDIGAKAPFFQVQSSLKGLSEVDVKFSSAREYFGTFYGVAEHTFEKSKGTWRPITAGYEVGAEVAGCDLPHIDEDTSNHEREREMARRIDQYAGQADDSPIIAMVGRNHLKEDPRSCYFGPDDDGTLLLEELDKRNIDYDVRRLRDYEKPMSWNQYRNHAKKQFEQTGSFDISPPTIREPENLRP